MQGSRQVEIVGIQIRQNVSVEGESLLWHRLLRLSRPIRQLFQRRMIRQFVGRAAIDDDVFEVGIFGSDGLNRGLNETALL